MSPDRKEPTGLNRRLSGRLPLLVIILLGTAAIAMALRSRPGLEPDEYMIANAARSREGIACSAKLERVVAELVAFNKAAQRLPSQAEYQTLLRERVDTVSVCPASPKTTLVIGPEGYFFVLACPVDAPCEELIQPLWDVAKKHLPYIREEVSFDEIYAKPLMLFAEANVQKLSDMEGLGDDDPHLIGFYALERDILAVIDDASHVRLASLKSGTILYRRSQLGQRL